MRCPGRARRTPPSWRSPGSGSSSPVPASPGPTAAAPPDARPTHAHAPVPRRSAGVRAAFVLWTGLRGDEPLGFAQLVAVGQREPWSSANHLDPQELLVDADVMVAAQQDHVDDSSLI